MNGASGISIAGRERAYATELWLDDPFAFWLHPEGPLSDTTPEEWKNKQPKPTPAMNFAAAGLAQSAAMAQYQSAMLQNQYADLQNYHAAHPFGIASGLSSLLGQAVR